MPVSRMRMRPWLEKQIESNAITGLTWVDKEKKMFSIPWKHAARHGWELDKDACLFKEWAIHTGKYAEGQTCDPKTWKANFRCAMNSLPDIEEVKDRSINKGHQAMRVFRMLPSTPKSRDKRSKAKETKPRRKNLRVKMEEDVEDFSDTHSSMDESMQEDNLSTQENTVDSTVNTELQDFANVDPSEVPQCSSSVEIESELFMGSFCSRFEVSPEHSSDYDDADEIIKICQQLESVDSHGFLSNEVCGSPWSHWSDSSSAEEQEDSPQYTTLYTDLQKPLDDFWRNFYNPSLPLL